jgi:radical SAM family RiPP maturation amino acid epimerase
MEINLGIDSLHQQIKEIINNRSEELSGNRYLSEFAQIKRLLERCSGDKEFQEEFEIDPSTALAKHGLSLSIDPEEVRLLWDKEYEKSWNSAENVPLPVIRYRLFIQEIRLHRSNQHSTDFLPIKNLRYKTWRDRQINRCKSQLGHLLSDAVVHAPFTFELNKGCSVGCWFCGISAPKLSDIFFYTPENVILWQETLKVLLEIIGPAASNGFCYWATDPLDNPDYENFLLDFYKILGEFPNTSTAQPLKDPSRLRKLFQLARENNGFFDRFSILSTNMLRKVHQEFTPDELSFVELTIQNQDEKRIGKHSSGRARDHFRKEAEKNQQEYPDDKQSGTIACVSGFLFNMVDRQVKLITPCNASEKWPLGYQIFQEGFFSDGDSLKKLLLEMIENHMPKYISRDDKISFRKDLNYNETPEGFTLTSAFIKQSFKYKKPEQFQCLTREIAQGKSTAIELAILLENKYAIAPQDTFHQLNFFFDKGFLDEEPA